MWPAVTPNASKGVVNTTYLGEIKTMIESLAAKGVYTLVDMHQDVWSPYLCGEGMPDWVYLRALELEGFDRTGAKAFPAPLSLDLPFDGATGYPDTLACQNHSFFQYYLTFESETAWRAACFARRCRGCKRPRKRKRHRNWRFTNGTAVRTRPPARARSRTRRCPRRRCARRTYPRG